MCTIVPAHTDCACAHKRAVRRVQDPCKQSQKSIERIAEAAVDEAVVRKLESCTTSQNRGSHKKSRKPEPRKPEPRKPEPRKPESNKSKADAGAVATSRYLYPLTSTAINGHRGCTAGSSGCTTCLQHANRRSSGCVRLSAMCTTVSAVLPASRSCGAHGAQSAGSSQLFQDPHSEFTLFEDLDFALFRETPEKRFSDTFTSKFLAKKPTFLRPNRRSGGA